MKYNIYIYICVCMCVYVCVCVYVYIDAETVYRYIHNDVLFSNRHAKA